MRALKKYLLKNGQSNLIEGSDPKKLEFVKQLIGWLMFDIESDFDQPVLV
ncbi:hypothetical protein JOD17_000580, partial [Geomicrobium sediminis]|nr:hypothetical protein [Geomicrobium sediminis]